MKKRVISLALLSLVSLTSLYGCGEKETEKVVVEEYVPVEVEKLGLRDISEKTSFSGKITASKEVFIVPKMPGQVVSVAVEVGSVIKSGSTVFEMDSSEIQKQVNQAKSALDSAKASYDMASQQAQATGSAASLGGAKAQVDQAEMAYNQAVSALEDASITSPIEGIVSQVNVGEGSMASNAQPAVVVLDLSQMYVDIDIPESMINKISQGQKVDIDMSTIEKTGTGTIESLSPAPDERTGLYKARVAIKDRPEDLKVGMFVRADVEINAKEDILAVKSDSIIEDGPRNYVYIVEELKAIKKEVELGIDSGAYTEVVKGLKKKQEVIVKGQDYVEDGTKVKIIRGEK